MSAELRRILASKAPFADGTNNTNELRFTTGVATSVNAIPTTWRGRFVEVYNESVTATEFVAVVFSFSSTQTATIGAAAANGGAATDRGRIVGPGQRLRMRLPGEPFDAAMGAPAGFHQVFFARISAAGTPNISISMVE